MWYFEEDRNTAVMTVGIEKICECNCGFTW